jgi:hypothetical protein
MFSKSNERLTEWHKDSAPETKNEDGSPKVFYHGTGANFETFKTDNGAIFLTPDAEFAATFETDKNIKNIMPVFVNAKKVFDFKNPKHLEEVKNEYLKDFTIQAMKEKHDQEGMQFGYSKEATEKAWNLDNVKAQIERETKAINSWIKKAKFGDWKDIEGFDHIIKKLGYDSFKLMEDGVENIAVFKSNQIKSVFNKGTFSESNPNILMSQFKTKNSTTKAEAQNIAQSLLGKHYAKHSDTLEIVQGVEDLPKDIKDAITLSSGGEPRGIFNPKTGKAYIIADAMKADEVEGVILHELLHKNINSEVKAGKSRAEAIMGSRYESVVKRLDDLHAMGNKQVREAFKKVDDADTPAQHRIEEVMTYLLENITNESKPSLIKWRDDVVQAIKIFIAKVGLRLGIRGEVVMSKMNSYDIANILRSEAIKNKSILENIRR